MNLENAQNIIDEQELTCSSQDFIDYYDNITIDTTGLEVLEPTIATFDQPYTGSNGNIIVDNPANGKYYYYITIGGRTFLQNIVPYDQGLQPLDDNNINNVIEDHKTKLIQSYINGEKLRLTIENFK